MLASRQLVRSVRADHAATVRRLLAAGACGPDVVTSDSTEASVLLVAAQAGHTQMVELLLSFGASLELPRKGGATPLFVACAKGHVGVVRVLLAAGADFCAEKSNGATPLIIAAQEGHIVCVQLLLQQLQQLQQLPGAGGTPRSNLLEKCVHGGWTAAHKAAQRGHVAALSELLDHGARLDSVADDGSTPLSTAAYVGHLATVRCLIDRGADARRTCTAVDGREWTGLQLSRAMGHREVAGVLALAELVPVLRARARLAWAQLTSAGAHLLKAGSKLRLPPDIIEEVAWYHVRRPTASAVAARWSEEDGGPVAALTPDDSTVPLGPDAGGPQSGPVPLLYGRYQHSSPCALPPPDVLAPHLTPTQPEPNPADTGSCFRCFDSSPTSTSINNAEPASSTSEEESEAPFSGSCSEDAPCVRYPLEQLRMSCPSGVVDSRKEDHLAEDDFRRLFVVDRVDFEALPPTLRQNAKRVHGLLPESQKESMEQLCDDGTRRSEDEGWELPTDARFSTDVRLPTDAQLATGDVVVPADDLLASTPPRAGRQKAQPYVSPYRSSSSESCDAASPWSTVSINIFRTTSAGLLRDGKETCDHRSPTGGRATSYRRCARQLLVPSSSDEDHDTAQARGEKEEAMEVC
jgi:ankyrin repeat protein